MRPGPLAGVGLAPASSTPAVGGLGNMNLLPSVSIAQGNTQDSSLPAPLTTVPPAPRIEWRNAKELIANACSWCVNQLCTAQWPMADDVARG
eukprot:1360430-Prymnesium_polylepis.3